MLSSRLRQLAAGFVVVAAVFATQAAFATSTGPETVPTNVGIASVETAIEPVLYGEGIEILSSHRVVDGRLVDPSRSATNGWLLTSTVIPQPFLSEIHQFGVFTDGVSGTLAMVHRSARPDGGWIVSVDAADLVDETLMRETLVHELAHLATLGAGDVVFAGSIENGCDGVLLEIGCAAPDSALARYAELFWSSHDEPAAFDANHFVNDYAATSVHEDLAETFLVYVLDEPRAWPPAIDAKLAFFEQDPRLGSLATAVRDARG